MTFDDNIRDEKLQYDKQQQKILALSSGKIGKCEYLTGEKILPTDQRMIEQAKFTYSPLEKELEKQKKTTTAKKKRLWIEEKNK